MTGDTGQMPWLRKGLHKCAARCNGCTANSVLYDAKDRQTWVSAPTHPALFHDIISLLVMRKRGGSAIVYAILGELRSDLLSFIRPDALGTTTTTNISSNHSKHHKSTSSSSSGRRTNATAPKSRSCQRRWRRDERLPRCRRRRRGWQWGWHWVCPYIISLMVRRVLTGRGEKIKGNPHRRNRCHRSRHPAGSMHHWGRVVVEAEAAAGATGAGRGYRGLVLCSSPPSSAPCV